MSGKKPPSVLIEINVRFSFPTTNLISVLHTPEHTESTLENRLARILDEYRFRGELHQLQEGKRSSPTQTQTNILFWMMSSAFGETNVGSRV